MDWKRIFFYDGAVSESREEGIEGNIRPPIQVLSITFGFVLRKVDCSIHLSPKIIL